MAVDKYDFFFTGVPEDELTGFKFFTRGFDRTLSVRGATKLINIWMKTFLTPKGSDPTNLERGTDFSGLFGANITNVSDVRDVVLLSIDDCNKQIFTMQRTSLPPDDETLKTAVLTSMDKKAADRIDVYVTISNVKNKEIVILVPLLTEGD
jgi:hypothetical protein